MNINAITNNLFGFGLNPVTHTGPAGENRSFGNIQVSSSNNSENQVVEPGIQSNKTNNENNSSTSGNDAPANQNSSVNPETYGLTDAELKILEELKKTDSEVRRHEMAHVAAGGRYVTSGANFTYKKGPDGKSYAVGGEVGIDTSPIPGDPQATVQKMRQIRNAALAPANPSPQDLKVASSATSTASKAMSELMMLQAKEQASKNTDQALGNHKNASDSYTKVQNIPEQDTSSFSLAV